MRSQLSIGMKIEDLTIISLISNGGNGKPRIYRCECSCGKIKDYRATFLINNKRSSCGCKNREDLTGKIFHRWTILNYAGKNNLNRNIWQCRCLCGTIKNVSADSLRAKESKSCGCYKIEQTSKTKFKDLSGKKFGKLFVIERLSNLGVKHIKYKCLCDCGRFCKVISTNLSRRNSQTCSFCKKSNKKYYKSKNTHRREGVASWRLAVFKKDGFRCVVCGLNGYLNAHHLNGYHWFVEGRNDVNNGVTLCADKNMCHQKFHFKYGNKNNTKEQFMEFLNEEKLSGSIV